LLREQYDSNGCDIGTGSSLVRTCID
jgi:hypothetical protein